VRGQDIVIRHEASADVAAIRELTKRAFLGKRYSDGTEQDVIDALRRTGDLAVSLVAEQGNLMIGHAAFSPGITKDGSGGWYVLGPISVDPDRQRRGIGGSLIQEGITRLEALKAVGCVVLGDTNYYTRHGFVPRPDLAPSGEPAAHYMVRVLSGQAPDTSVSFHPAFGEPGVTP
jgi:putative acetyltransferase